MKYILTVLFSLIVSPLFAQFIEPNSSSSGGTFPPTGCVTVNGVIFNNVTPCNSNFIYDGTANIILGSNVALNWNSDTFFTRSAAATIQFGAADVNGSPVAQTVKFQSALAASASNTASANTTIIGSLGTGTGTNGNIIFQIGVKTSTGTAQATATTALTITGETGKITAVGLIGSSSAGTAAAPSVYVGNATTGLYSASTTGLGFSVNGVDKLDYGITIGSTWVFAAPINMGSNNITGIARIVAFNYQSQGTGPVNSGTCPITSQTVGVTAGQFTMNGVCAAGTIILSFAAIGTVTTGYSCDAHDQTAPTILFNQTANSNSSSTLTVIGTTGAADVVVFKCIAF